MRYKTEAELRKLLRSTAKQFRTQAELAKAMGVNVNFLSQVMNGAPLTGKIVAYLGYRKARIRLYEPLEQKSA